MVMFNNFHLPDYYGKIIATLILVVIIYILRLIIRKVILKFANYSLKSDNRSKLIIKYFNSLLNILFVVFIILLWGVDTTQLFGFVGAAITFIGVAFFCTMVGFKQFYSRRYYVFCVSV